MEHPSDLLERIGDLLFDEESSDVTFIVGGEALPAHRAILITSCKRFRTLFRKEGMKEPTKNEVVLEDVSLTVFKLLMEYTYTGRFIMTKLNTDSIFDVLEVAHHYGFTRLESTICQHLKGTLSIENVCAIYNKAHSLTLKELMSDCFRLIYRHREPNAALRSEACCDLSEAALLKLFSDNFFCADELEIFKAVVRWCEKHPRQEDRSKVLAAVRLPLIDTKDLVTTVKDSGLFTTDILLDAIRKKCEGADLNSRGRLNDGINLARRDQGALILTRIRRDDFVTANTCPGYKSKHMPPYPQEFDFFAASGLTIALMEPFWVNCIRFRFRDDTFTCSYNIEVSLNLVDWARIVDHSGHICRASQNIYFGYRVVGYIRLIITEQQAKGEVIKLSNFMVIADFEAPELSRGFYIPGSNVASAAFGATVIESLDGSQALIEDKTKADEKERSKWTSHKIGKGAIVIHLTQPVAVKSMRMLLKGDDSQAYLYYIETSLDKKTWIRVADHTTSLCRSWQNVIFEELPVLFIRIVGTASTEDEFFSCANFECPAPKSTVTESPAPESEAKVDAAPHA